MGILDDSLILTLASDVNYDVQSDAYDATATKVEPTAGQLTQGRRPGRQLGAQHQNWIDRELALYLAALHADDAAIRAEFDAADDAEAAARAAADGVLAAAIAADVANLADLIDNGFAEGWPKLKAGNSVISHTEYMPFFFRDAEHAEIGGGAGSWTTGFDTGDGYGSILGAGTVFYVCFHIKKLRNDAKLKKVRIHYTPKGTHVGLPANLPNVEVFKGTFGTPASIGPTATVDPLDAPDTATWNSGSTAIPPLVMDFFPTAVGGEVIDDQYFYFIKIQDEHGANAIAGNRYWGASLEWEIHEVQP